MWSQVSNPFALQGYYQAFAVPTVKIHVKIWESRSLVVFVSTNSNVDVQILEKGSQIYIQDPLIQDQYIRFLLCINVYST